MRLGVLSDIHLQAAEEDRIRELLPHVVDRFNTELKPDAVVVPGDMVQYDTADRDRAHLIELREALSALEMPVYYTAGNHDVEDLSAEEVADVLDHRLDRHVTRHDHDLIVLDTTSYRLDGVQGELSGPQLQFLERALDRADDAIVCVHHPIHYHDLSDEEWFTEEPERAFLINKHDVRPILRKADGLRAVVNGHLHESYWQEVDGIPHITVNAFNKEKPDSTKPTGSHALVTVDDDGVDVDRFDVDDL